VPSRTTSVKVPPMSTPSRYPSRSAGIRDNKSQSTELCKSRPSSPRAPEATQGRGRCVVDAPVVVQHDAVVVSGRRPAHLLVLDVPGDGLRSAVEGVAPGGAAGRPVVLDVAV